MFILTMKVYKESYIKKKSHKDSIKNRYDSRGLQILSKVLFFILVCGIIPNAKQITDNLRRIFLYFFTQGVIIPFFLHITVLRIW